MQLARAGWPAVGGTATSRANRVPAAHALDSHVRTRRDTRAGEPCSRYQAHPPNWRPPQPPVAAPVLVDTGARSQSSSERGSAETRPKPPVSVSTPLPQPALHWVAFSRVATCLRSSPLALWHSEQRNRPCFCCCLVGLKIEPPCGLEPQTYGLRKRLSACSPAQHDSKLQPNGMLGELIAPAQPK